MSAAYGGKWKSGYRGGLGGLGRVERHMGEAYLRAAEVPQAGRHRGGSIYFGRECEGICFRTPIHLGSGALGTFGLLLWLAAVCATALVLHRNFVRNGVDADALNVVALGRWWRASWAPSCGMRLQYPQGVGVGDGGRF